MKKYLAALAVSILFIAAAQAQTEKGTKIIGGSIDFNKNKSEGEFSSNINSFIFSPKAGYFISNNFAIGTNVNFGSTKVNQQNSLYNNYTNHSVGVTPFVRHYLTITERFRFISEFNLSWSTSKQKPNQYLENEAEYYVRSNYYSAKLSPGLAFFPTKKWAIEMVFPFLSYGKGVTKFVGVPDAKNVADYRFDFALSTSSPLIGVNYHF